jgi:hypothetical protein
MMAATAITENCVLISADTIYTDIQMLNSELKLENWLA